MVENMAKSTLENARNAWDDSQTAFTQSFPTDPYANEQWHLQNEVRGLLDLNVDGVWSPTEGRAYTGEGTRTVVIDDGFDYRHGDLAPNYLRSEDYDYQGDRRDALGSPSDSHGTAVAGIIGAARNGSGAVGISYDTDLIGYRYDARSADTFFTDSAAAIRDAARSADADVINMSIGIPDQQLFAYGNGIAQSLFSDVRNAIDMAVTSGRDGLGSILVKAAGNGRFNGFDVNSDMWTNDTRQIVVGAVDQDGFVSNYSNYGSAILVSAFGTPGEVVTTDRTGSDGYEPGGITSGFNGTSAATPMVAGVVNLMLEANPDLGWRDVQSILAASARHVGSDVGTGTTGSEEFGWDWNGATTWNGGAMHFSADYGYGLVDARAAVRLAETWLATGTPAATSDNQRQFQLDLLNSSQTIPDGDLAGRSFNGNINGGNATVERVQVEMRFDTTYTGDVAVYLMSPDGTRVELISAQGGTNDFDGRWTFESQAFRGEAANGQWRVQVVDRANGDILTVDDLQISVFMAPTRDDRYIFTNELSDYIRDGAHSSSIHDSNGGNDTANAAAVNSASVIRLQGGESRIDGTSLTFTDIENAIGGDHDDLLQGNAEDNVLLGMRGADRLYAAAGNDVLSGGDGNDVLVGQSGSDRLGGQAGNDTLSGNGGNDLLGGGSGNDRLNGGDHNDRLFGGNGADRLIGGGGADQLIGNNGNDLVAGQAGGDRLLGGAGNDKLYGGSGGDRIAGQDGHDELDGSTGNDVLAGQGDNDRLRGGIGHDSLYGGEGTDTLAGGGQNDLLNGGDDEDAVFGGNGADTLIGDDDNDRLGGGNGDDLLFGGDGADFLTGDRLHDAIYGGEGNDIIIGGGGRDTLYGQLGHDRFVFGPNDGHDTVIGFSANNGEDIDLSGLGDIRNFQDLVNNHVENRGGEAVIVHAGGSITLTGIGVNEIGHDQAYSADDFIF